MMTYERVKIVEIIKESLFYSWTIREKRSDKEGNTDLLGIGKQ